MKPRFPEEIDAAAAIGGKARALWALSCADFPVPAWCVLPSGSAAAADDLDAALARLRAERFAVRSSAIGEDGAHHSFAGQFESFLEVPREKVAEKIAAVIASARSDHVRAYCAERRLPLPVAPAVVLQRMIEARAAGVAFSAEPVSGRRSQAIVAAVRGLGSALVAGEKDADTWTIAPGGEIISVQRATEAPPSLSDAEARKVAALARRCEEHFGVPQDIEWALDESGALFLLQSRPITTLGTLPDPDDTLRVWDNSNIAESYGGVTTPLTFSFARHAYEHVYRQFCRLLRVPRRRIEANDAIFPQMLGHIRGRVYYNLLSWYRVLALLPGFNLNRRFMEQMMGVREPLPEAMVEKIVLENRRGRLADSCALAATLAGLVWNFFRLPAQIRSFQARLDSALAPPEPPLPQRRGDELVAAYRELERRLLTRWDAPLINDFFAMIFHGLLRHLCAAWADDRPGTLANDLLRDDGEIISAEPARRIARMAALAPPDLARELTDARTPAAARLRRLREHAPLAQEFDSYLERFGDRCLEELKLESPTLTDDPGPLLASIGALAQREKTSFVEAESREIPPWRLTETPHRAEAPHSRETPDRGQAAALARIKGPLRRALFRWICRQARQRVRHRENLRFERTRLFGQVRTIFRELGRRLTADGVLDTADDVFFLEVDEVLGAFEGTTDAASFRGLVGARRAASSQWQSAPAPPDRFATCGPAHRTSQFVERSPVVAPVGDGDQRQGLGTCPGVVRGQARVVLEPRGATILPGEILVAKQTDPGWIVLFPAAAGLLVERGSLLSHSAIVSRELGLPCVVSLPGLTAWLRTGDLVEMDGQSGLVRKISSEP